MMISHYSKAKFSQAALGYLVYGLLYESFAAYSLLVKGTAPVSQWVQYLFLVIGLLFSVLFSFLVYRGIRWFTRLLTILVGLRLLGLGWTLKGATIPLFSRGEVELFRAVAGTPVYWIAFIITLTIFYLLLRAGWGLKP